MPLDIALLSPQARERYLAIGRRYTSADTLAQAHKTMLAHAKYGLLLVPYGFGMGDGQRLGEARDRLHVCKVDRTQVAGDSLALRNTHTAARRKAKVERRCVRSVLDLALGTLIEDGDEATANRVQVVAKQTRTPTTTDQELLEQLDMLADVLADEQVAEAIADRGGPEIAQRLEDATTNLSTAVRLRAAKPDLSAVADERDILDGIIVSLTRAARNAARITARHLGQPAIEAEFKLTHLRSRPGSDPELDAPSTPEEPETEPVTK
jgi:hypothetical protein